MQEIFNQILQLLSANSDALVLSVATGLAAAIAFAVKYLFALVQRLTQATPTALDDNIIEKTRKLLKDKLKDM